MTATAQQRGWRSARPGILIALLVLAAYLPALRGEFLWDDDSNVVKSAPLRSLQGLAQIWFQPGATQQYYPLTHTSFWLDYHLWGLHTTGYHLENILLHACASVLLWLTLRRLGVKGAWLGAALFALHPVNVESVAWITERKNCLSGPFFMGAILAAIKFWRLDQSSGFKSADNARSAWKFYFLSLALFLCALLSKTATIGLPAVIVLLLWWKHRLSVRRDFFLLLPFFTIGIALALVTMFLEKHHLGATGPEWSFSPAQRCIIAGRALWFYLGKLLWPHPLMFMYPLWPLQTSRILSYIPLAAAIVGLLILWLKRQGPARHVLLAAACFIVMLFPILGFFNVVFYHYSFVCDHFQYLAGIGPLALAAAGITIALERISPRSIALRQTAFAALLSVLFVLTWRQAGIFRYPETLWRDTLAHNPDSWMAHDNLATCLSLRGEFREAGFEYLKALKIRPEDYLAWNDLGLNATRSGNFDDAITYFTQALQLFPSYALGHYNLGNAYARKENFDDAVREFNLSLKLDPAFAPAHYSLANALARKGDTDKAIEQYKTTLQLDPDFAPAHANLGRALAAKGNLDEAITHYRAALDLDPASVEALANLANALVGQKRFDEAIRYYRAALQINPGSAVIHYNLAVALDRQGNKAEAQKELAEASRLKSLAAPGH